VGMIEMIKIEKRRKRDDRERERSPSYKQKDGNHGEGRKHLTEEEGPEPGEIEIPRAEVSTNSAGEISCSIVETNRIRAALGLAPLEEDTGPSAEEIAKRELEKEESKKQASMKKFAEKLAKTKNKRLLHAKLPGRSLGDQLKDEDQGVYAWVEKSRKLEEEKKKAELMEKQLTEQDQEATKDIAPAVEGLKVVHNLDDIGEGDTELVLKDVGVLEEKESDELMNLKLVEKEKTRQNEIIKKSKGKPLYNVYEEAEKMGMGIEREILSKYNDKQELMQPKGFVIGQNNVQELESIEEKMKKQLEQNKKIVYDLSKSSVEFVSEYFTAEEIAQFKKPRTEKKRRRKKVRTRKTELSDDQVNGEGNSEMMDMDSTDYGSRSHNKKLQREEEEKEQKRVAKERAYTKAMERAEEESSIYTTKSDKGKEKLLHDDDTGVPIDEQIDSRIEDRIVVSKDDSIEKAEKEEEELNAAVSLARQSNQTKGRKGKINSASAIALAVRSRLKTGTADNESDGSSSQLQQSLVFTPTTEFCRSLPSETTATIKTKRNIVSSGPPNPPNPLINKINTQPSEVLPKIEKKDINVAKRRKTKDDMKMDEQDDDKKEKEDVVQDEPLISTGIAATLSLIGQKGGAKQFDMDSIAGRANDQMVDMKDDPAPHLRLEKRDEWGRIMTPRESFRQLSHKFHGKRPGKKKQQKKIAKMQEELKRKQMSGTDTPLHAVEMMRRVQEVTKLPYIVLSGHAPTQISLSKVGVVQGDRDDNSDSSTTKKVKKRKRDQDKSLPDNS